MQYLRFNSFTSRIAHKQYNQYQIRHVIHFSFSISPTYLLECHEQKKKYFFLKSILTD